MLTFSSPLAKLRLRKKLPMHCIFMWPLIYFYILWIYNISSYQKTSHAHTDTTTLVYGQRWARRWNIHSLSCCQRHFHVAKYSFTFMLVSCCNQKRSGMSRVSKCAWFSGTVSVEACCPDLVTESTPLYSPKCPILDNKSCDHPKGGTIHQLFVSFCSIWRKQN